MRFHSLIVSTYLKLTSEFTWLKDGIITADISRVSNKRIAIEFITMHLSMVSNIEIVVEVLIFISC